LREKETEKDTKRLIERMRRTDRLRKMRKWYDAAAVF